MNPILYEKQARKIKRRVFFTGTTAVSEGQGFCYDRDYGTAAEDNEYRDKYVELPSATNNLWFAGVAAQAYTANANGQWIVIYEPGSVCHVLTDQSCTVDTTYVTCCARSDTGGSGTVGTFFKGGFHGEGTALALETADGSSTATLCLALLLTGEPSGLVETLVPVDNAAMTNPMIGGVTFFADATTLGTGDSTATMGDGLYLGQRKAIICDAAITTNDIDVTVTNHETSSPEHLFFDANGEATVMEWCDTIWAQISLTAATS